MPMPDPKDAPDPDPSHAPEDPIIAGWCDFTVNRLILEQMERMTADEIEHASMPWCEACCGWYHLTAPGCFKDTPSGKTPTSALTASPGASQAPSDAPSQSKETETPDAP